MSALQPDEKACPFCAETIKAAAVKCRYCGSELPVTVTVPDHAAQGIPQQARQDPEKARVEPPRGPAPESAPESAPEVPAPEPRAQSERTGLLGSGRLTLALLVLVLLAVAALARVAWNQDTTSQVQGPIKSTTARTAGVAAASRLTEKALSYRWSALSRDVRSAEAVMTPGFRQQYAKAMARVHDQALRNHITLKATVVAASAISASDHQVQALVFVNQVTTTKGSQRQRVDQNRVIVTLVRDAGDWQISRMKAF